MDADALTVCNEPGPGFSDLHKLANVCDQNELKFNFRMITTSVTSKSRMILGPSLAIVWCVNGLDSDNKAKPRGSTCVGQPSACAMLGLIIFPLRSL